MITMVITAGELLSGSCFTSEQARLNAYVQAMTVVFPLTATAINYGSTTPSVDNQALPWYRLNPDGSPDNWYSFYNGQWSRPNPIPASSPLQFFYDGDFASLPTFDGGDSGSLGVSSGPMWEPNPALYGRFPLGSSGDGVGPYFPGSSLGSNDKILAVSTVPSGTGSPATFVIENNFSILNRSYVGIWIKRTSRVNYVV